MKIAAVSHQGQIAHTLSESTELLVVTADNGLPVAKEQIAVNEKEITGAISKLAMQNVDVVLAGEMGTALQSALRMLGVELILGCTGGSVENIAGYLAGEKLGDPSKIVIPEEDENDPMNCMHDCARCMADCSSRPGEQ